MVPGCSQVGEPGFATGEHTGPLLALGVEIGPVLATVVPRGHHVAPGAVPLRLKILDVTANLLTREHGVSVAMTASADLSREYAWSSRTTRSRDSQWRAWLPFCEYDHRAPLPVSESHLVAFIG